MRKGINLSEREVGTALVISAIGIFIIWNIGFRVCQAIFL